MKSNLILLVTVTSLTIILVMMDNAWRQTQAPTIETNKKTLATELNSYQTENVHTQGKHIQNNVSLNPFEIPNQLNKLVVEPATSNYIEKTQKILRKQHDNLPSVKIKRESEAALQSAREQVKDFKKIYKKPEDCYNMKNNETRVRCANHFMQARREFEKEKNQKK